MVVLEYVAEKVLSPILSEYLEGFSTQNMKFGLWAGKVEITNVCLKKETIKKFNLPFNIRYSKLGLLTMTIPWKSLASSKTEIVVDGLEIIINEIAQQHWQCKDNKIILSRKKEIEKYCQNMIKQFAKKQEKQSNSQDEAGYLDKMVARIIDNIEVVIKNIHIRVQDQINKQYAFGLTLQLLSLTTVNQNDQPTFIDRTLPENKNKPLRKSLLLSNFGVYWDQKAQFFLQNQYHKKMIQTIACHSQKPQQNYLILISLRAKLIKRMYDQKTDEPENLFEVEFNQLNFEILNMQFKQMISFSERLKKYLQRVKQLNKVQISEEEMNMYLSSFTTIFQKVSRKEELNAKESEQYQNILQKMDVENFIPIMKRSLLEQEKDRIIKEKEKKSKGWFSGPKLLTEQEKLQIQQYLETNFGSSIQTIGKPQGYFFLVFKLKVKRLTIAIGISSAIGSNNQVYNFKEGLISEINQIKFQMKLRQFKMNETQLIQEIMKNKIQIKNKSQKIGIVFLKKFKSFNKYFAMFTGNYIYLYADNVSNQPESFIYTKKCKLKTINNSSNNQQKKYVLQITTKFGEQFLGFDRQQNIKDWVNIITLNNKKNDESGNKKVVVTNPNSKVFELNLDVKRMNLKLITDEQKNKYLDIIFDQIGAKFDLCESKTEIRASLKRMQIEDNITQYKMAKLKKLLYTVEDTSTNKIIDVRVLKLTKENQSYNNCDLEINLIFGTLVCNFKPDTVSQVMAFIFSKIQQSNTMVKNVVPQIQNIKQQQVQKITTFTQSIKQNQSIRVNLKIGEVSLTLVNKKTKTLISCASIHQFKLLFTQSLKGINIAGSLGELVYEDFSKYPYTIVEEKQQYESKLLMRQFRRWQSSIVEQQVNPNFNYQSKSSNSPLIIFDIVILNNVKQKEKKLFVKAQLQNLQLSYLQQPILRIITYLNTQLLPCFQTNNSSNQIKNQVAISQMKPQFPSMDLKITLKNISVYLEPHNPIRRQYLKLNIQEINVYNLGEEKENLIQSYSSIQEKAIVQTFFVNVKHLGIFAEYGNNKLASLTNLLNIDVSCQLPKNSAYYYKIYKERWIGSIKVKCQASPFFLSINNQDYNFVMKCLNWCITYNDNADFYLYNLSNANNNKQQIKEQKIQQNVQPLNIQIVLKRLSLCVKEMKIPIVIISVVNLQFIMQIKKQSSLININIDNIIGTYLKAMDQEYIQKGLINSLGYQQRHLKDELQSVIRLSNNFHNLQMIQQITKTKRKFQVVLDSGYGDQHIKLEIQQIRVATQIETLMALSKVIILDETIQPPKPFLQPRIMIAKSNQIHQSRGKKNISIKITNLMASLIDSKTLDYIVVEGNIEGGMLFRPPKCEQQVIKELNEIEDKTIQINYIKIGISNFEIYFCNIKNKSNKRQVLKPICIQVSIYQFYEKKTIEKNTQNTQKTKKIYNIKRLQCNLEQLKFQATLKDIIKINAIIQDNLQSLQKSNKKGKIQNSKLIQQNQNNMLLVPQKVKINQIDNQFIEGIKQQAKKNITNKIDATIYLKPIQLTIVNNIQENYMPVFKCFFGQTTINYGKLLIKQSLSANIALGVSFFNSRSSKWEPCIQMFQIHLDYIICGVLNHLIIKDSQIEQLKQLKINISSQLLSSIMQTLQLIKKENKLVNQSKQQQKIQVSPYIFENLTNQSIFFIRNINDSYQKIQLKPYFYGPIRMSQKQKYLEFNLLNVNHKLSLEHYGIIRIPKTDYFIQFNVQKLSRFIRFTSKKILRNSLKYRVLYCRLQPQDKKKDIIKIQLACGKRIALDFIDNFQISLDDLEYTQKLKIGKIQSKYYLRGQKDKFLLTMALELNQTQSKNSCIQNIVIKAPLLIYNCLPKTILMQFLERKKFITTKEISPQSQHEVVANKMTHELGYRISIKGTGQWAQQFKLQQKKKNQELNLTIPDDYPVTIKYVFSQHQKSYHYILKIYCLAFIVSQISEPIRIYGTKLSDEIKKNIQNYQMLGGQKIGDFDQTKVLIVGSQVGTKLRICGKYSIVDFSQPVVVGGIGMSQTRVVIQKQIKGKKKNLFCMLGIQISIKQMHQHQQIFSKQIKIRTRSIVINSTGIKLLIKQVQSKQYLFQIQDKEKKSFYFSLPELNSQNLLHILVIKSENTEQSKPLSIEGLGVVYFYLKQKTTFEKLYFKIIIQQIGPYMFFQIKNIQQDELPYQIIVKSKQLSVEVVKFGRKIGYLEKINYFNENYQKEQKFEFIVRHQKSKNQIRFLAYPDNLNFNYSIKIPIKDGALEGTLFCQCYVLINDSKKFLILEQNADNDAVEKIQLLKINIKMQKISFSLIQNHISVLKPYQSFYIYLYNLQLITQTTNLISQHQIKLQFLQFDQSQPFTLMNPVIITPQKYQTFMNQKNPKSIFNVLIEIDNSFKHNLFINKFVLQFNDIVVKISSQFIKIILKMIQEFQQVLKIKIKQDYSSKKHIQQWRENEIPKEGSRTFIKSIKIAPFTTIITAQLNLTKSQDSQNQVFIFKTILNALGIIITNIQDAPILLDGLEIENCVDTLEGIQAKVISHYKSSVIKQFYKIFGSLNILGNPVGLFRNISTGIRDFKDKPAEGFVEGPLQLGKGLAQGTTSLIAHSVGGALNSVQKFTGTVASGVAALAFDQQFEEIRNKQKMQKPKHVIDGLGKGGVAIFTGFKQGITGVFTKPYENSKKQGITGFFKGTAQGLAGLIIKPVSGIIDFASKTTEGLKNTALYMEDKPNQNRIRYPRVFYTQCQVVRAYNSIDSKLNFILHKKKYLSRNPHTYIIDVFVVNANTLQFAVIMRDQVLEINLKDQEINFTLSIQKLAVEQILASQGWGIKLSEKRYTQFIPMSNEQDRNNVIEIIYSLKREYN